MTSLNDNPLGLYFESNSEEPFIAALRAFFNCYLIDSTNLPLLINLLISPVINFQAVNKNRLIDYINEGYLINNENLIDTFFLKLVPYLPETFHYDYQTFGPDLSFEDIFQNQLQIFEYSGNTSVELYVYSNQDNQNQYFCIGSIYLNNELCFYYYDPQSSSYHLNEFYDILATVTRGGNNFRSHKFYPGFYDTSFQSLLCNIILSELVTKNAVLF
jgi:hypothetical protein